MKEDKAGLTLTIPSPCAESWQAMQEAGPSRRHCAQCNTDVVDVALLTADELQLLVARTGGDFCARLTQRADGSLLLREPESRLLPVQELLRPAVLAPVVASAMLACGPLPLAAQKHAALQISCADVTAAAGKPAEPSIVMPAPPVAAAPAPQSTSRDARPDVGVTMGQIVAIEPISVLSGTVVMPGKVRPVTGTVTAQRGKGASIPMTVNEGRYSGVVPRGRYTLRADVRGDDGQLYVAVSQVLVGRQAAVQKLIMQGPMAVTAGAPVALPPGK